MLQHANSLPPNPAQNRSGALGLPTPVDVDGFPRRDRDRGDYIVRVNDVTDGITAFMEDILSSGQAC